LQLTAPTAGSRTPQRADNLHARTEPDGAGAARRSVIA